MWAVILAVMPGLGHVYVGYYRDAFRNIAVVCVLSTMLSSGMLHRVEPPVGDVPGVLLSCSTSWTPAAAPASTTRRSPACGRWICRRTWRSRRSAARSSAASRSSLLGLMFFTNTMFGVLARVAGPLVADRVRRRRRMAHLRRPAGEAGRRRPAAERSIPE